MKRYEFICKGRKTHTIEATSEENARAFFAENRHTAGMEIIDVIEKEIPAVKVYGNEGASTLEGFTKTISEAIPTKAELKAQYDAVPPANRF